MFGVLRVFRALRVCRVVALKILGFRVFRVGCFLGLGFLVFRIFRVEGL